MATIKIKGSKKILKKAYKSKHYNVTRGHKLYTILKVAGSRAATAVFSYSQLNRLAFKYSRPDEKYDRIKNRGFIGVNFYSGYIGKYFDKLTWGLYTLNHDGIKKLEKLEKQFGGK